jgi:Histidine biosynthesis protein
MPCLLLRKGQVCLPGPDGPEPANSPSGTPFDPFDVVDRLAKEYSMLYVVDLDGIEHQEPQLDYLQEISRDMTLWVDGGVRTSDQAIDILVAGARRAVLSSAYLQGPRQLKRAWRLSTEIVFEIEFESGHLALADTTWGTDDPLELARIVREVGPDHVIVSPRETDPDWGLVARVSAGGPTWVDGSFRPELLGDLATAGGAGGIFHIDSLLTHWTESPLPDSGSSK